MGGVNWNHGCYESTPRVLYSRDRAAHSGRQARGCLCPSLGGRVAPRAAGPQLKRPALWAHLRRSAFGPLVPGDLAAAPRRGSSLFLCWLVLSRGSPRSSPQLVPWCCRTHHTSRGLLSKGLVCSCRDRAWRNRVQPRWCGANVTGCLLCTQYRRYLSQTVANTRTRCAISGATASSPRICGELPAVGARCGSAVDGPGYLEVDPAPHTCSGPTSRGPVCA